MKRKIAALLSVLAITGGVLSGCAAPKEEVKEEAKETEKTEATETATEVSYKDGVYKAAYKEFDERGWKSQIEIEIKDGKIATVAYDSLNKDGKSKKEDAEYKTNMEAKTKTYPEKYSQELNDKLVEVQDVSKVDTVSGATGSTEEFKALAKAALEAATKGDTNLVEIAR